MAAALLFTALVLMGALLQAGLRRNGLRRLARDAEWDYKAEGPPELVALIVRNGPALGAADMRVTEVLRREAGASQLAVARVDFALGSVRQRRDNTRIVGVISGADGVVHSLQVAPIDLPRLDQYRHLLDLLRSTR